PPIDEDLEHLEGIPSVIGGGVGCNTVPVRVARKSVSSSMPPSSTHSSMASTISLESEASRIRHAFELPDRVVESCPWNPEAIHDADLFNYQAISVRTKRPRSVEHWQDNELRVVHDGHVSIHINLQEWQDDKDVASCVQ